MLANATVTALVGTMQEEASTSFYRDTLGLKFITDDGFAAVFEGNNARVRVSRGRPSRRLLTPCWPSRSMTSTRSWTGS